MGFADFTVPAGGTATIAVLAWYFFGPKTAQAATLRGGVQEVDIEVKGGYSPDLVRVKVGMPVRLVFNRQDNSGCTERVVFPDFNLGRSLAAFAKTPVEFIPTHGGELPVGRPQRQPDAQVHPTQSALAPAHRAHGGRRRGWGAGPDGSG